ncbi:uncharacterized protein K452DRAFT_203153, partial [Aplosporella prunicola CBS 121167]
GPAEVTVRFLVAPINPLDMLVLSEVYPVKPSHHLNGEAIIGYDGVGEVIKCGPDVDQLRPGDKVIPAKFGVGTWRTAAVLPALSLQKLGETPADLAFAAILRVTVAPAYCLVEDMATLRPGAWIMQNAGTSAVAQMVVQFARMRGLYVVNIIRDRPGREEAVVKQALRELGVDLVLTEAEVATPDGLAQLQARPIMLALDSVFGASGQALVKALAPGGTYVQLGFLSGAQAQLSLDASDVFGRNLTIKAFRGTVQLALRSPQQQADLCDWFVGLFNRGLLQLPTLGLSRVDWEVSDGAAAEAKVVSAIKRAQDAALGQRKQILV